jgi:carbon-monoxide dehydrogenase medium subunit
MSSFGYAAPQTLSDAIALLTENSGARLLAGGHRLLVEPQRSRLAGSLLVDLRKIDGLSAVAAQPDGGVDVGPMTTLAVLAVNESVRKTRPALAEAARITEDAQIRNRATLGGSLAGADPEADVTAPVIALDARIQITGSKGVRTIAAEDLITGPFQTSLGAGDVITGVSLPAVAGSSGSAYERIKHPATLRAICGVAASVTLSADGAVTACRLAVTGATDHAMRLHAVENALLEKQPGKEALSAAIAAAGEGLTFRGDHFASAEYRRHLMRVLAGRALQRALDRATSDGRTKTLTAGGDQ